MDGLPGWQYDEMTQSGIDYSEKAHVKAYDQRYQRFRDYEKEAAVIKGGREILHSFGCQGNIR